MIKKQELFHDLETSSLLIKTGLNRQVQRVRFSPCQSIVHLEAQYLLTLTHMAQFMTSKIQPIRLANNKPRLRLT
jgi:hypothetical protein